MELEAGLHGLATRAAATRTTAAVVLDELEGAGDPKDEGGGAGGGG